MATSARTDETRDQQAISEVMAACYYTDAHARRLLKLAKGDATAVIARHKKTLDRYSLPRIPSNDDTPQDKSVLENKNDSEDIQKNQPSANSSEWSFVTPECTDLNAKSQNARSDRLGDDGVLVPGISETTEADEGCEPSISQWSEKDFKLPAPPMMPTPVPGEPVLAKRLVSYLYHGGIDHSLLASYLSYQDGTAELDSVVDGFPTIFYAAATNDDTVLRMWIDRGANINAVHPASGTPLLAFAVLLTSQVATDTTSLVATLLSLGASPSVIPAELYTPYLRDPVDSVPEIATLPSVGLLGVKEHWCTAETRKKLVQALNLVQRYYLDRATYLKAPSARFKQIAADFQVEPLLGLQYFLIGQTLAANALLGELETDLAMREANHRHEPLVLAFAGPSGHGKTELARQMGHLLNLPLEVVDCTTINKSIELFGGRHPYMGAEKGSPLNNFLAAHSGQPCIVFLDEFEKTTQDIHHSLLLPFDNGVYEDRRNGRKVNCTETIWIFATNALDKVITQFCDAPENAAILSTKATVKRDRLQKKLSRALKAEFLKRFEAPITGRVSEFIPFLPFSYGEQAVVARKFLLKLEERVRRPVVLAPKEDRRLLGDVRLVIKNDGAMCEALAASDYHAELGARSLARAVKVVEKRMVATYLNEEDDVNEGKGLVDYIVDFRDEEVSVIKSVHEQ